MTDNGNGTAHSGTSAQAIAALDGTDRQLVALLRNDSKRTLKDLGHRVGLSATAVKRRIDRLEARGVIRGYAARVDDRLVDGTLLAVVHIFCPDNIAPSEIARTLRTVPEVRMGFAVTGEADALALVRVGSIEHLHQVIERLRRQPLIDRTRTEVVLATVVDGTLG